MKTVIAMRTRTPFAVTVTLLILLAFVAAACKPKATPLPAVGTTQTQPQTQGASPRPSPSPASEREQPENPPQSGGLTNIARSQVGPFKAISVSSSPTFLQLGASEAIRVIYEDEDGAKVSHILALFENGEQSLACLALVVVSLRDKKGYEVVKGPLDFSIGGQLAGKEYVLEGDTEINGWTNGPMFASAEADFREDLDTFLKAIPY
jgi:hypothetical protein